MQLAWFLTEGKNGAFGMLVRSFGKWVRCAGSWHRESRNGSPAACLARCRPVAA